MCWLLQIICLNGIDFFFIIQQVLISMIASHALSGQGGLLIQLHQLQIDLYWCGKSVSPAFHSHSSSVLFPCDLMSSLVANTVLLCKPLLLQAKLFLPHLYQYMLLAALLGQICNHAITHTRVGGELNFKFKLQFFSKTSRLLCILDSFVLITATSPARFPYLIYRYTNLNIWNALNSFPIYT